LELLQPEVVEEVLRRAEHRRLARNVAMANDTYPVPLQERANDVAADRDAPHFLDLSTRDRLPISDQSERFEEGPRISRSAFLPQGHQPVTHRAPDLNTVAACD